MFLENTHRVTVELKPDQNLGEIQANEEKMKLSAKKASLSPEEIEHVVAETAALKLLQETPDSPEALKCIPALSLSDIPKTAKEIPCDIGSIGSTELLTHDLFTNDIIYAEHLLDMKTIPEDLLPLVPLWTRALGRMGTSKEILSNLTKSSMRKPAVFLFRHLFRRLEGIQTPSLHTWFSEVKRPRIKLVSCTI